MTLSPLFQKTSFDALAGWRRDDAAAAYAAFRRSAMRSLEKPYRSGALGVEARAFEEAFAAARVAAHPTPAQARSFFERFFVPHRVEPQEQFQQKWAPVLRPELRQNNRLEHFCDSKKNRNAPERGHGFVTGFYEPEVEASPLRTDHFRVPLLARPDDLVETAAVPASPGFGRATADGIVEYYDRHDIEQGALAGRGLEIAWLADTVDAFFIHVQGAARLIMTDGTKKRVTYSGKTGHPFTGPGGVLAGMGEIAPADVTMQSIRRWFRDNPHRINEILWRNRSYIFFREAPVDDDDLGPIAAAKTPLTPGRSIAVDRLLHTFATPFYVVAPTLDAFDGKGFARLMIAQDTGSAITGPARGDLFAGSGHQAGEIAGVIRHPADFFALVPRALVAEQQ